MISLQQIPLYATTFLKFCSNKEDVDGCIMALDNFCLEVLTLTNLPIMQDVVSPSEKFIAVYSNVGNEALHSPARETQAVTDESKLELSGCPLECPFPANNSLLECSILAARNEENRELGCDSPLPLSEANKLLALLNLIINHLKKEKNEVVLPLIAILCDGEDVEGTRAIGIRKNKEEMERFRVTCKEEVFSKFPKFELIKRKHLLGVTNKSCDVRAKAKYVILENLEDSSNLLTKAKTGVWLECEWKSVAKILEAPSSDAKCIVHFSIVLDDHRSLVVQRWNEIMLLEDLISSTQSQTFSWIRPHSDLAPFEKLKSMTEEMKKPLSKWEPSSVRNSEEFDLLKCLAENRKNLDSTDKLWDILKDCSSISEIHSSLQLALENFSDGQSKPPVIYGNKSKLGSLIKDIFHHKIEVPELEPVTSLEYLIEIGIEKLRQDYLHIFLVSGLTTKDVIDSFTSFKNENVNNQLLSLKKLHLITEIISLTQSQLNPSHGQLCSFTRLAIKYIREFTSFGQSFSYSFPIDRQVLVQIFSENLPVVWTVNMKSVQDGYESSSAQRYSIDNPSKGENFSRQIKKGLNEELYYVCNSTLVKDRCC